MHPYPSCEDISTALCVMCIVHLLPLRVCHYISEYSIRFCSQKRVFDVAESQQADGGQQTT